MAVKASANITLFHMVDIDSTTIYYLLQSSTANPPAKPTTDNPGGNWTTTEPTYTEGSTNTLYTVTKTKFSDGTFEYTPVSKSSSYEAAKNAYNKALNAENTANTTQENLDNLQIGGKNILRKSKEFGNEGVSNTETGYLRSKGTVTTDQSIDDFTVVTCTPSSASILGEWLINGCKNGETYTLSFWVKGTGKPRCYFYGPSGYITCEKVTTQNGTGNSSDGNSDSGAGGVPVSNSEWQRVWVTWKLKDTGGTTDQKYVLIRNDNKVEVYVAGAKFERGNKPTDWSPAPEDIDNKLNSYKEEVDLRFRDTVSTSTFEKTNGQLRNEMISNYGINYILDSMGVFNDNSWTGDVESIDYHNAVGLHAIVINNNTISQKIRVKGGEYTLSFTYIKNEEYADNDNAKLTVKFYDEIFEYTDSVNFKQTKNVFAIDDNVPEITIEISGNVDNLGIIYDLMLNDGTEIKKWQQNQNETVTDEVTIGRGITCKSSISDTTSYMNTDGFRVKSNSTNIEVMKATSVGGEFNELKSRAKTELNGLLILKFDDVIWLNGGE